MRRSYVRLMKLGGVAVAGTLLGGGCIVTDLLRPLLSVVGNLGSFIF